MKTSTDHESNMTNHKSTDDCLKCDTLGGRNFCASLYAIMLPRKCYIFYIHGKFEKISEKWDQNAIHLGFQKVPVSHVEKLKEGVFQLWQETKTRKEQSKQADKLTLINSLVPSKIGW
jgi:hypothetical protein